MPAQMTPISSGPTPESFDIAPVSEIIAELRAGRIVILVDEEDREN
jgi:3,4-dihydroxy 2-butanone 4-phosphate synthase / GTP cyclohydrolase II